MDKLLEKLSIDNLSGNEVSVILGNPKDFPVELVEKLSIESALLYWNQKIDFEEGDCIMNNLYSFWLLKEHFYKNFDFGETPWACFNAFDAGEYYRPEDDPKIDPVETYTKPMIEKLLKKIKEIK
jgi:hypothetical protein